MRPLVSSASAVPLRSSMSGSFAPVSPVLTRTTSASSDGGGSSGGFGSHRHVLPGSGSGISAPPFVVPTVEHLLVAPQRRSTVHPLMRAPSAEPLVRMVPSPISSPTLSNSGGSPRSDELPRTARSGSFSATGSLVDDNSRGKPSLNAQLLRSLSESDGRLTLALLRALKFEDLDNVTQAAVEFYLEAERDPAHPQLVNILNTILTDEVNAHEANGFEREEDPATLFRGKTNASKMLSLCLRKSCNTYLKLAIGPTITEICTSIPSVEIDPTRVAPEVAETNATNLYSLCERFLLSILSTVESCPIFIRRIFAHVQRAASARYPENKQITVHYSVIGGFIFLRFICSAIFTPVAYGAVDTPPKPEATRALALVSKVLQMLANGLSFTHKESYMQSMNPFLDKYREALVNFLRDLADAEQDDGSSSEDDERASMKHSASPLPGAEVLLGALHKYAADLASSLHAQDPSGASMKALAEFLRQLQPDVVVGLALQLGGRGRFDSEK
ncbi:GTPaseactivating protein [Acanthamoeba castellanii str. Neff]|uniref:GTPaseactivating protein n=1 Tax=Acanthamoeba castellanii (strain ATCC 30010 / Neff) TaxID=1257118 RepID=L8GWJ6_ACACF|nr:GTPaseactivating protein [Acanthamoeba castellanii str. Neff]ELR17375.1 GTPaseactivating protein [Acanthamoeba castellanii str. Neff]